MMEENEKEKSEGHRSWGFMGSLWGIIFGVAWHNIALGFVLGTAMGFLLRYIHARKQNK